MKHGRWYRHNTTNGKGWAVGYHTPRARYLYNMGTNNGKHPFDIREMLRNLESVLAVYGPLSFRDFASRVETRKFVLNKEGNLDD